MPQQLNLARMLQQLRGCVSISVSSFQFPFPLPVSISFPFPAFAFATGRLFYWVQSNWGFDYGGCHTDCMCACCM